MVKIKGQLLVKNKMGLHARPCAQIVHTAEKFPKVKVTFSINKEQANGRNILEIMILAVCCNSWLEVTLEGPQQDCKNLWEELQKLFANQFYE